MFVKASLLWLCFLSFLSAFPLSIPFYDKISISLPDHSPVAGLVSLLGVAPAEESASPALAENKPEDDHSEALAVEMNHEPDTVDLRIMSSDSTASESAVSDSGVDADADAISNNGGSSPLTDKKIPEVVPPDCMDKHPFMSPLQVLLMPARSHLELHYQAEKQEGSDEENQEPNSAKNLMRREPDSQNLVYTPRVKRQEDGSSFNATTTASSSSTSSTSSSIESSSSSESATSTESHTTTTAPESTSSTSESSSTTETSESTSTSSEESTTTSEPSSSSSSSESTTSTSSESTSESSTTSSTPSSTSSSTESSTPVSTESSSESQESKSETPKSTTLATTTTPTTPIVTSSPSTFFSTTTSSGVVHTITQVTYVLVTHTPSPAGSATPSSTVTGSLQTKENAGVSYIARSGSNGLATLVTVIAVLSVLFVGVGAGGVLLA